MSAGDRARYIDGLRTLASVLEAHPEIPLPQAGGGDSPVKWFFCGSDAREQMAATARALPCTWRKEVSEESEWGGHQIPGYLDLYGSVAGLSVKLVAERTTVCRRVVTGTEDREVEEVIRPAETRKVVRPVEVVFWDCGSLLSPLPASEPKAVNA